MSPRRTADQAEAEFLRVVGARVHNLKNVNVAIPLQACTVITGVSGSGKSSLAFDTIYAEGQRRYVESLSAYARQFLERMEKPDVDAIEGIAPAVAIRQKTTTRNPRSTVATATEIHDYLRLLLARVGQTICPDCDLRVERDDVDAVAAAVLARANGRRAYAIFPVIAAPAAAATLVRKGKRTAPGEAKGETAAADAGLVARLGELRAKGFPRLFQAGKMVEFSTPESLLELDLGQPIFGVADRLLIEPEARARLVDAIETAYREAGEVRFVFPEADEVVRFSQAFECRRCGRQFAEPTPLLFSFNNPHGACPRCQGFGNTTDFDPARVIPNPNLTLDEGAIEPWTKPRGLRWRVALKRFAQQEGIAMNRPWHELRAADQTRIYNGAGRFGGVKGFFEHLEQKKYKVHVRVFLSRYRGYALCPACQGARLRPEAMWVRLAGGGRRLHLGDIAAMTVTQAVEFFTELELAPGERRIADAVLIELRRRLGYLQKVGLDYLTLDRVAGTLSGGESQRIQLATCLGAQLVGSLYVLDEPSIGLHPRDTRRLIAILNDLRDLGNTILVVEHDPEVMRASDHLIDMGPGAGEQGGQVVAEGTWQAVAGHPASLTGQYLRGELSLAAPAMRRERGRKRIRIQGAYANNLRQVDVDIPLGMLVAVTGVSGSGKSSMIHQVLHRNLQSRLQAEGGGEEAAAIACSAIEGTEHLHEVILVDQSPIGRTPRSNPVTYLKAFDGIRELFAQAPLARRRGYRAGHFSFNVPGGRCETCQGDGVVTVDMQFLADVALTCEECDGQRFQAGILEVQFQDKNIAGVLELTVREAITFFERHPKVARPLRILEEIGLSYLRLGQSATTLSGGEAQRLKLAAHLAHPSSAQRTLFLLDEPTTGLHFDDIAKLLAALQRLIEAGGSVVVIEHNLEIMKAADWILDLGPEAGAGGGQLVAQGTPEEVATAAASHTAPFLAAALATG